MEFCYCFKCLQIKSEYFNPPQPITSGHNSAAPAPRCRPREDPQRLKIALFRHASNSFCTADHRAVPLIAVLPVAGQRPRALPLPPQQQPTKPSWSTSTTWRRAFSTPTPIITANRPPLCPSCRRDLCAPPWAIHPVCWTRRTAETARMGRGAMGAVERAREHLRVAVEVTI